MIEKDKLINLDDKTVLKSKKDEQLEEEYKQGIKYQSELESKKSKTKLF